MFAIAEGVRGRAVRREIYERVSVVGIGIVLLLFVIGYSTDTARRPIVLTETRPRVNLRGLTAPASLAR